ncbi:MULTISPECIES: hypothetical protein [Methylobacterium]|uniref:hypothetical protein n=1 Tax=Methylobacterium TaxID=407 RepID=UPI0010450618|nr:MULTISPECIES: hypothetical protein [Methylobacterium]MDR7038262.1 hypothetical protein [Methylobacterium sp. BE186]
MRTRLSVSRLAAGAALASGVLLLPVAAQAACVGFASCQTSGNKFAAGGAAQKVGTPAFKPATGVNPQKLIGNDGSTLMGKGGNILSPGNVNPGFRAR